MKITLAQAAGPAHRGCGFGDRSGVFVDEATLRNTIRDVARAERATWFVRGTLLNEGDASHFGHLVRYWLHLLPAIPMDNLQTIGSAVLSGQIDVGILGEPVSYPEAQGQAQVNVVAPLLTAAAARPQVPRVPRTLQALVNEHLYYAWRSHIDHNASPWSAVFISTCARLTEFQLGLEGLTTGSDQVLLQLSAGHLGYVQAAYRRAQGNRPQDDGHYHAFEATRPVQVGDIVITDRRAPLAVGAVHRLANILNVQNAPLHGDIVTDIPTGAGYAVAIGGNLGASVRARRYPLNADGSLVVVPGQGWRTESLTGVFQGLPRLLPAAANLQAESTGRIFAVLSPVPSCPPTPTGWA